MSPPQELGRYSERPVWPVGSPTGGRQSEVQSIPPSALLSPVHRRLRCPGVAQCSAVSCDRAATAQPAGFWCKIDQMHWSAVLTRRGEGIRLVSVRRSRDEEVVI